MRGRLTQPVLLTIACLLAPPPTYAQGPDSDVSAEAQPARVCPTLPSSLDQPPKPDITISEVDFLGALQLPPAEQEEIATSLKQRTYTGPLERLVDEAVERVRVAWQDRGYFKVQVSGNAMMLTSSPVNQRIVLTFRTAEGLQYRLGRIRFLNNKAISDARALRTLFPIADGDIFSRELIAKGLDNLRKAYGELGYINFTSVPDIRFDDEKSLIYLGVDIDEGKRFRLSSIRFPGLDETAQREVSREPLLQPGQFYNGRLYELFLQRHGLVLDSCNVDRRLDERAGTVAIRFACGRCPVL